MQHIEAAQYELNLACQDLAAVIGVSDDYSATQDLAERVKRLWSRVEQSWIDAARAPFIGDSPFCTLDGTAAPDGIPRDDEHPHRGCGDRTGGVRFHGLLHSTAVGLLAAVLLIACGADDDTVTPALDGPAPACDGACPDAPDAAPDAGGCVGQCEIDAAGGDLPINAPCEPTLDECAAGLTCRIAAAHDGICRPVGLVAEGEICTSVDQCGADMACIPAEPPRQRCSIVCDVAAPKRCAPDQTCAPFWGADTGLCS